MYHTIKKSSKKYASSKEYISPLDKVKGQKETILQARMRAAMDVLAKQLADNLYKSNTLLEKMKKLDKSK